MAADDRSDSTVTAAYARLLSLAVHEFRTPASVVSGYLRMLLRDQEAPLSDRHRKMVEEAEKSCARLVALVAELSEVSKLDAGTAPFKDERFDLFPLLSEVASTVHESADRGVLLEVRGEAAGAPLKADRGRIGAAFEAIFRAVLREQPSATTVVVQRCLGHPAVPAGSAVVVVARLASVQTAYNAPPGPFDEKRGGLGLQLPMARRVIERYGGHVWSPLPPAESGESSRDAIIVSLPVESAA